MDIFVRIVGAAATAPQMPKLIDQICARVTVLAIRLYRVLVASWRKRDCLFNPSCSRWSEKLIAEHGFSVGTKHAFVHMTNCCGDYRIQLDANNKIMLVAKNGVRYSEEQLSEFVLARFKGMSNKQ